MAEMTPHPFDDLAGSDSRWPDGSTLADEAVSAELDGMLDGLATDLGVEPAELRRRLHDWDGYAERRDALAGARDALAGSAAPELGELTRRRLVSRAVRDARPRPRRSRLLTRRILAPAVAAAVLVVLAVAAVIATAERTGDDAADLAPAAGELDDGAGAGAEAADAPPLDLGEVSDPLFLRDALAAWIDLPEGETAFQADSEAATVEAPRAADEEAAGDRGVAAAQEPATPEDAARCADQLAESLGAVAPPLLVATATFEGAPAVVVVLELEDGTQASVVSASDCGILSSQFFVSAE